MAKLMSEIFAKIDDVQVPVDQAEAMGMVSEITENTEKTEGN